MKFDPDIALKIMRAMEDYPEDEIPRGKLEISDVDDDLCHFHCRLLEEAGYITVYASPSHGLYWPRQIKWPGAQFLAQFPNDSLWQRAKDVASEKGVGMALDTLLQIGKMLAADMLKQIG